MKTMTTVSYFIVGDFYNEKSVRVSEGFLLLMVYMEEKRCSCNISINRSFK